MSQTRRWSRAALSAVFFMLAPLGAVACGGEASDAAAVDGGEITISYGAQPDYLDPALSYSLEGWEALPNVYTGLLTYRRAEGKAGTELIPGLAEDLPEISGDGETYSLVLRDGLEYSDGTPVKASDFEHAIKRVLNLGSGGAPFYQVIDGATEYLQAGDAEADIPGIETDDRSGEIEITLAEPDGSFSNILAMPFASLVPDDTEFENLTEDPPPGVGPYMITESVPNRQFVLDKNPRFEKFEIPSIPTGNLDRITVTIIKNVAQQTQDVLANEVDYMQNAVPPDLKPTVFEQADDRYEETVLPSTYYMYMNMRQEPFDDPLVREAVNYGIDKPALARPFGGLLEPGCSFLPPDFPGYDEAFDTTECPYGDPSQPPDIERARELIEQAGAEGAQTTVWGDTDELGSKVAQAYADMLNEIGLDAELKLLDPSVFYQAIGNETTQAPTGSWDWYYDFPHPLDFFLLVDGDAIQPRNNLNYSYVDDKKINDEIDRLRGVPDVRTVAEDWSKLNRYLVSPPQSYVAPFGHNKLPSFFSERMDAEAAIFHPIFLNDYTSFALEDGE